MKVNGKLKKLREDKGLTLDEISKKIGISKPYYWQIENGERNLYYKWAIKIAKVFNMKPDEIFYNYYKNLK